MLPFTNINCIPKHAYSNNTAALGKMFNNLINYTILLLISPIILDYIIIL